jgi:hypothetical protein
VQILEVPDNDHEACPASKPKKRNSIGNIILTCKHIQKIFEKALSSTPI